MDLGTVAFAVLCIALWLGPVAVIVVVKRIARRYEVDLGRQPPPDEPDYKRW